MMDDLISRKSAIEIVKGIDRHFAKYIEELPSAEPDIIRCEYCKHYIRHDKRCGYWNHGVKPTMWCSQAERREDE